MRGKTQFKIISIIGSIALIGAVLWQSESAHSAKRIERHYSEHIANKNHWTFQRWFEWRKKSLAEYRDQKAQGIWRRDPRAAWRLQGQGQCLSLLGQLGVTARPMNWAPTPAPSPVEITAPISGVKYKRTRSGAPLYLSCELAARLPTLSRIFKRHGVHRVHILSAYRVFGQGSFHSMGLALDISALDTPRGRISLKNHFALTPDRPTCPPPAHQSAAAQTLAQISCEIFETRQFSTVITPNYNQGHRNHYHIDIRPDDARLFVR